MKKELTWEEKRASAQRAAAALNALEAKNRNLNAAAASKPRPVVPAVRPERPSGWSRLKALAEGVGGSIRDKINNAVPNANKEYQENQRRRIDNAVDGMPSDKKEKPSL